MAGSADAIPNPMVVVGDVPFTELDGEMEYYLRYLEWMRTGRHGKIADMPIPGKRLFGRNIGQKKRRRYRAPEDLRQAVMKRDGNKCVRCGSSELLCVHHKTRRSKGGEDNQDNLITLCSVCHIKEHKKEGVVRLMRSQLRTKRAAKRRRRGA